MFLILFAFYTQFIYRIDYIAYLCVVSSFINCIWQI